MSDDVFFLSGLEELPEDFDFLPLNFGDESVFLLGFPDFDFLDTLGILFCDVLFSFDDALLH